MIGLDGERMVKIEDYKVNKTVCNEISKFGFHDGVRCIWLYKNMIQLVIIIDSERFKWECQVRDVCNNSLYAGYYNYEYGRNELVEKIDKQVQKIISEMVKNKILIEK